MECRARRWRVVGRRWLGLSAGYGNEVWRLVGPVWVGARCWERRVDADWRVGELERLG